MTIETANRLVELRKKNNLSQEELAEKLGVSRQAVSKWERSEASPDTDNLIALAEIYGMSLDELIFGEKRGGDNTDSASNNASEAQANAEKDSVKIGPAGIFVKSKDGDEVNISLRGIKVSSGNRGDDDDDDFDVEFDDDDFDVEFDDDEDEDEDEEHGLKASIHIGSAKPHSNIWLDLTYPILCAAAYLAFGFCNIFGGWALSWIIFITIPIYHELVNAITKRRFSKFHFAIPVAFVYLYIGLYHEIWHPTWLVFFAIPILDPIMVAIDKSIKRKKMAKKAAENIEV